MMLQQSASSEQQNDNLMKGGEESETEEDEVVAQFAQIQVRETASHSALPRVRNYNEWDDHLIALAIEKVLRAAATSPEVRLDNEGSVPLKWILAQPQFKELTVKEVDRMLESKYGGAIMWKENDGK